MSSFDEQLGNIIVENRTGGDGLIGHPRDHGAYDVLAAEPIVNATGYTITN
jgi:hypothetical protein